MNTATYNNGWNITTTEHDQYGNDVRELTANNRATALAAGTTASATAAAADQLDTESLYSTDGTELLDTYGPAHQAMAAGTLQTIRTHSHNVYDAGAPNNDVDASGSAYMLVTSSTVSASLGTTVPGSSDVDGRTTQYVYNNGSDNEGWTLGTPLQTITDPGTGHLNVTKTVAFNENPSLYGGAALQISSSQPSDTTSAGAGTTKSVYYTAGSNPVDSACGNQPVWAGLLCKTEPAAQPGTAGLASLPVTTTTYNVYLEPTTVTTSYTAADGTTASNSTTTTYDAAGRQTESATTTTGTGMGSPVAPVQTVYNPQTGVPSDHQSLNASGAVTADLYATYDDWGQLSSYTDASGNVTYYTYDLAGNVTSRSDSGDTSTLTYDSATDHSGDMTSMADKVAGTFGAVYDADGSIVSESYPGGTTAAYTYDTSGAATSLSYSNSAWSSTLNDTISSNAEGDWVSRDVLASQQSYTYDNADRLTSVADDQGGQCTTRSYTFDVDSNRLSSSTAAPASDGSCQTASSTTTSSTYDSADRLTNAGYTYDTQGDITTTPSADTANGSGDTTATYYADSMIASQAQNGATTTWQYDPNGDRVSTFTNSTGTTYTNHYAGDGDGAAWVSGSDGSWSRDISGPTGLVAQTNSSGTTLQLVNLHGDVMATVDEANSSVTGTETYTEFGAPETGTASTYGWLGSSQRPAAEAGQILMGDRVYNPQTGRFNQTDPVPGGSANPYDYGNQNPVTQSDPTGDSAGGFTSVSSFAYSWEGLTLSVPLGCFLGYNINGSERHISSESANVWCMGIGVISRFCNYHIDFEYENQNGSIYGADHFPTQYRCDLGGTSNFVRNTPLNLPWWGKACAYLYVGGRYRAGMCHYITHPFW